MLPPPPRKLDSLDINGRLSAQQKGKSRENQSNGNHTLATSAVGKSDGLEPSHKYGLDPKPELDNAKAEDLCGLEEGKYRIILYISAEIVWKTNCL